VSSSLIDTKTLDRWLREFSGDVREVEIMLNRTHMWESFAGDGPTSAQSPEAEAYREIGLRMTRTWREALSVQFPGREFVIELLDGLDEYGPTIVAHSA